MRARWRAQGTAAPGGAVVTGAARGLGLAIARELHRRGYAVRVADVDGGAAARAAAALGPDVTSSTLDVRDEGACGPLAREVAERSGGLAVWVNNAGILATGPAWESDPATRRAVLDVNTAGSINGTIAALDVMRAAGRGVIVNVVSLAGLVPAPGMAMYTASKHALLGFSVATQADLRAAGLRDVYICCVCPAGIATPMLSDRLDDPAAASSFTSRLLTAETVATRVGRLLDRPRPVVAVPAWRGWQSRLYAAFPRLALGGTPLVLRRARSRQRRYARRGLPDS